MLFHQSAHPYEVRRAADLTAHGVRLVLHICGNTTTIMADIATTGATMIEFDYKADMARCRAAAENVTPVGNVNPSDAMALGAPDRVLQESHRAIEMLGKNGRFILSSGCTLPATTPSENVEAMMEAARTFERYHRNPDEPTRQPAARRAHRDPGLHPDGVPHQSAVRLA